MTKNNAKIEKRVMGKAVNGTLLTEIYVCVEGSNMKEVEKVFDKKWGGSVKDD